MPITNNHKKISTALLPAIVFLFIFLDTQSLEMLYLISPAATECMICFGVCLFQGQNPMVYYSPMGKATIRTVPSVVPTPPKGAKLDNQVLPGYKLKTENKKPIVGLACHPHGMLFL